VDPSSIAVSNSAWIVVKKFRNNMHKVLINIPLVLAVSFGSKKAK
jgi:hypothetical protein